jgi:hypothetical protein
MSKQEESIFAGELVFNGINAATGEYALPPMSGERLARLIRGRPKAEDMEEIVKKEQPLEGLTEDQIAQEREKAEIYLAELQYKQARKDVLVEAPAKEGVDPTRLDQAGWAVVFPARMEPNRRQAIKEAMEPLLDLRQQQAGELFRVFEGGAGYRPRERKDQFFERQDPEIRRGPADPEQMPFYVLLVGSPEEIPYDFQYQLDVMRGVGRIDFGNDLDTYARYARSVVLAETGKVELPRRATFFGVANPGDKATRLSAQYLVKPLYDNLQQPDIPGEIKLKGDWQLESLIGDGQATRAQLQSILGDDPARTPTLLFSASHGMEFPLNHDQQLALQGALLCQDWDGPGTRVKRDHYFAGQDLAADANLLGMMAVFFACYGAGTPKLDQFARQAFKARAPIAPQGFIGALPRRMLTQGALAVLGHVERAWGYSFVSPGGHLENQAFITALRKLFNGDPVGLATDPSFNMRYADMSSDLSKTLEELEYTPGYVTDYELAYLWTANNDARGYVVIGDPAVRLPVADVSPEEAERPTIEIPTPARPASWTEPPAAEPEVAALAPEAAVDYGLPGADALKRAGERLADALQRFADKMGEALDKATDLEIRTYVAADMQQAPEDLAKAAQLRAYSRVDLVGNTQVVVPGKEGQLSEQLWKIHCDSVEQAKGNRNEMLKMAASAASSLLEILK